MPKLKTVIFGLDYDLLGYDYKVANEIWKDRQYYPYTGMLYDNSWGNRIQAYSAFFRANRDLKLIWAGSTDQSSMGIIPVEVLAGNGDCKKRAFEHSVFKYVPELNQDNLKTLEKVMCLSDSSSVRLLLLNPPKQECYYDFYNAQVVENTKRTLRQSPATQRVNFLDLWRSPQFFNSDFIDSDHLAKTGVAKIVDSLKFEN